VTKIRDFDFDISEAWTVKPGETVLLRSRRSLTSKHMTFTRELLDLLEERTGVHFVLLDADVEVVNPHSGESA
jgi:hypothetical protein